MLAAMSVSRLFTVIGDMNIRRNMTELNIASRESMKNAQVIDCVSLVAFDEALSNIRKESSVLIVAAVTEFIMSIGDCGTVASTIDPVLSELTNKLCGFCLLRPNLQVHTLH